MQLYGVRIFVDDYDAARRFYADTLGLEVRWEMAEQGVAGFAAGAAVLIVEADLSPERLGDEEIGRAHV